ncbi:MULTISPECIES: helix-turn-helix domain-containing protein [Lactococcus]|uniref:HTH cro/C1-type domain-containing protein n=2 Tax=Lactococcus garvieae TaxID=1363 RepID=F9VGK4_LACGL|nr:helix-turn-helix transcriptional regulator [Lactococcus garvieae]ETD04399.1 hypothetical protein N568_0107970 [Lactococcus garvieae TRF1]EOT31506.1 hypothetical protein OO3_01570 [Lactococcus garvieae ATCC 49156]EOT94409.1 hypothetical protein I578_01957 [Lactococcus garvieae ATCC 49156]QSR00268.1 helix-turn-helix transcriptional regulator [Lactococcus garvieae]BAK57540.1 hypothetical protein LCGT_0027 [Lactococcus garvieae ATCC 49156]
MANLEFGKQIKKIRNDAGLSMEEFAKSLNINKSRVNMWENNGVVPRADILQLISEKYKVSVDTLLGLKVIDVENQTLKGIYRNLKSFDEKNLEKAESLLKLAFDDLYSGGKDDKIDV